MGFYESHRFDRVRSRNSQSPSLRTPSSVRPCAELLVNLIQFLAEKRIARIMAH